MLPAPAPTAQTLELRTTRKMNVPPGGTAITVPLCYSQHHPGPAVTIEVNPTAEFTSEFGPLGLRTPESQYHNSANLHAFVRVSNVGDRPIRIPCGTLLAVGTVRPSAVATATTVTPRRFVLQMVNDDLASATRWVRVDTDATDMSSRRLYDHPELATRLAGSTEFSVAEALAMKAAGLHLDHYVRAADGACYVPVVAAGFAEGGPPLTKEDLAVLGFDLSMAIDPGEARRTDGTYPPLSDDKKEALYRVALRWWYVWARDAKAPALSRLVVLEVPTGDAAPVAQRPYPLPYKYLDAVRAEVKALLAAGLIEPCISNWASRHVGTLEEGLHAGGYPPQTGHRLPPA